MYHLEGLRIINEQSKKKEKVLFFSIIPDKLSQAIDSILTFIENGRIVTLNDNRDKREGAISIKKVDNQYWKSGGGHGFHDDWKTYDEKMIRLFIKITVPFNNGVDKNSVATAILKFP